MTMQKMVEYLESKGFETTKVYSPTKHAYEFTIKRNGISSTGDFVYSGYGTTIWKAQEDFLDNMVKDFEKLELMYGRKNKMKNIAFDISRDGPVGKLIIKDNVYDVCVKEVNCNGTLYNETTMLKVEVAGKNLLEPKLTAETRKFVKDTINNIYGALGITTTYNPDRKDSINDGKLQIKDVIFNPPATIVFWSDGSKTVVKAENEVYDPEKGLAMAIAKRAMGNKGNYFDTFKKYIERYEKKVEEERASKIAEINAALDKPYHIWFQVLDSAYEPASAGVYFRTYKRRCDATRVANKQFSDETKFRYMVARENPWTNGEWAKKFGSDS